MSSAPERTTTDRASGAESRPGRSPAVVAVLPARFPIPPDAGTPRPYHLLHGLRERAEVSLLAVTGDSPEEFARFAEHPSLRGVFTDRRVIARRPRPGVVAAARTLLAGLPPHSRRYHDPGAIAAAHAAARELAARRGPVVFYVWSLVALQWIPEDWWGSCALDLVDAPVMAIERRLASDRALGSRERLALRLGLPALRRYEGRALSRVGVAILNSSVDLEYVRARHPGAPLVRVIDGGDADYFAPEPFAELPENDEEITFVGNMGFPPNADAARHLARDVMPLVWQRRPNASAVLIGPDPQGVLADLHQPGRIEVTGFVPDVRPWLRRATVVVSPLRFGAGMKNKLQAGLAMEKAMVASTVTREGFDELVPGRHAIIADGTEEFAAAILALLDDPDRRRALGRAGRELIRTHFSWSAATESLWQALQRCTPVREPQAPR